MVAGPIVPRVPTDAQRETAPGARTPGSSLLWLALLGVAIVETIGHFVVQARVVPDADWAAAGALVREGWREGDLVVVAPTWADPLMRREVGDLLSLEDAGRTDLAQYGRLWALSVRGHRPREAPPTAPELVEVVGAVTILRWDLEPGGVLYDFTEHVRDAQVTMVQGDSEVPCPWSSSGRPRGGGLGAGPVTPAERHQCDPRRGWLWVGTTIQDDLDLQPRYCIWQHPAGPQPIRALFRDVPLGDELVLDADIYYEHERMEEHGPVEIAVTVGGREIGRMVHRDGDGWKRMVARTTGIGPSPRPERGDVAIEVSAPNPDLRSLCWAATTREARR